MNTYIIIGAGAIGGTIGAYMIRGGEEVLFVDQDPDHVEAINRNGLTIRGYAEEFKVAARAITSADLPNTFAPASLTRVILATKAQATRAATAMIQPYLAPDGYILSAQNGLNELTIQAMVGAERTIGCFVNFSADYLSPGLIHFGGPGAFFIGELDGSDSQRLSALRDALAHWGGGPVRTTANIWGYLWGKLGYGAMLFATALSNLSMADAIDQYRLTLIALAREIIAIADAEGVQSIGFDGYDPNLYRQANAAALDQSINTLVALRKRDKKTHSGIWRDLAIRKRKTELDPQMTIIAERGRAHGIATPLLDHMIAMLREIENGQRPMCSANLDALTETHLCQQVSSDWLWRTNSEIAKYVRLSGTAEERQAFDYCRSQFNDYGYTTQILEHPALVSWPLSATLHVFEQTVPIACLGTAYSKSVDGLVGDLVDVGYGSPADYAAHEVRGKIVLVNGLASPSAVLAAEQAGSIGQIFINDAHLHYMIVSPIWGTPTPESAANLPSTPSVSVREADGHALRAQCAARPVQVVISTQVLREWKNTPILIADLPAPAPNGEDDFVLFSGHLDSWDYGAMDNGSANSTMLEVARVIASQQKQLRRSLRLAMWSGHSHGRYSGSTWYADTHWEGLHDHCVAHVNIDSTGARGATFYGSFPANLELGELGVSVIQQHTQQLAHPHRHVRAGDMSFNGIGIPALFMSLSQVPMREGDTDYVSQAQGALFGGKMPWWWHTVDDTLDKVDLAVLALDTRIYVSTIWRLLRSALLPMDFRPVMSDIITTLTDYQEIAASHFDFGSLRQRAKTLQAEIEQFNAEISNLAADIDQATPETIRATNRTLMQLSRILIPITYTRAGQFDHDPALGQPHLPTLACVKDLAAHTPNSDAYHFTRTRLQRNANTVALALRKARERVKDKG